jgi:lipoprotein NlpD
MPGCDLHSHVTRVTHVTLVTCATGSGFAMTSSRCVALALALMLLAACSSTPTGPATYTVKRGDTLYSIAWRHQLDYRDVARWNRIGRDYVIHPGQQLKLRPPGGRTPVPPTTRASTPKPGPVPTKPPAAIQPAGPPVLWQWPVEGGTATLTTRANGGQGLMIGGQLGQEIRAAGPGRVVYTGTGLLGYGQLVIIKHNETYLSAYGHTQAVAVREGDAVATGQRIATMGAGTNGAAMLYFEIRINGAPGNPLLLLPQRR